MEEPAPAQLQPPAAYEAPAISWEEQLTALTACSPPCAPEPYEYCVNDVCIPGGG